MVEEKFSDVGLQTLHLQVVRISLFHNPVEK